MFTPTGAIGAQLLGELHCGGLSILLACYSFRVIQSYSLTIPLDLQYDRRQAE